MAEFLNNVRNIGKQFPPLAAERLDLLGPEIQALLDCEGSQEDIRKMEFLLDHLYDCIMWGLGKEEYEILLQKLEKLDTEAADYYRKVLFESVL